MLYRIECFGRRPFVAGAIVNENGLIIKTAPILWRWRGQPITNMINASKRYPPNQRWRVTAL